MYQWSWGCALDQQKKWCRITAKICSCVWACAVCFGNFWSPQGGGCAGLTLWWEEGGASHTHSDCRPRSPGLCRSVNCAWQRFHCSELWGFGAFLFQKLPLHYIFAIDRSIPSMPWALCKCCKRRTFSINTDPQSLFPILFTHADFQLFAAGFNGIPKLPPLFHSQ